MITIRKNEERGHFNHGWLETFHSFSFSNYYDPKFTQFRQLRVINEDTVMGGEGFDTHSHENMEIITYVIKGALEHKDSIGTGSIIRPGAVQRMTAGSGVSHSEFNHSKTEPVHLLQIWILPNESGLAPSYEEKSYSDFEKEGTFLLVGSQDGRGKSVTIHQDVNLYATILKPGRGLNYENHPSRHAWLQMIKGNLKLNGLKLHGGDGVAISGEEKLDIYSGADSEFLLFDLS